MKLKPLILLTLLLSLCGVVNASLLDKAKADKDLYSQIQHSTELMELLTYFSKTENKKVFPYFPTILILSSEETKELNDEGFREFTIQRGRSKGKKYSLSDMDSALVIDLKGNVIYASIYPQSISDVAYFSKLNALKGLSIRNSSNAKRIAGKDVNFNDFKTLEELNIYTNSLPLIEFGVNNKSLKALYVYEPSTKIAHLDQLTNLEYLTLVSIQVPYLSGLEKVTKLKYLDILSSQYKVDLPSLVNFPRLQTLLYRVKGVNVLKGLSQSHALKNLQTNRLDLNRTIFPNNLEILKISGTDRDKTLPNLNHLINLTNLRIMGTGATKMTGFDQLTNLTKISLIHNDFTKISGLDKLTKLKNLHLDSGKIIKISGLDNLVSLEELSLTKNKITKIEGFKHLKNIISIEMDNNPIVSFEQQAEDDMNKLQYFDSWSMSGTPLYKLLKKNDPTRLNQLYEQGYIDEY
jgi:hypothetical protein